MDDWMEAYRVEYKISAREEKEWHDALMDMGGNKVTRLDELKQAAQDAEDALAAVWFNLRDWMAAGNTLNVSQQRDHIIVESKRQDIPVGYWAEWHVMACEPELHPEGRKLVEAVSEAGRVLENADKDVQDYSVYHVFTRSLGAMMSGTGVVQRLNETYDLLPRAVSDVREQIMSGRSVEECIAVAYIWHGSKNFGFDDDGKLQGEEPDVTLVISDALIKRNYNFDDITITGVMDKPFVEV